MAQKHCSAKRRGCIRQYQSDQLDDWSCRDLWRNGHAYRTVCLDAVAQKYLREYIEERGLDIRSNLPLFTYKRGKKDNRPLSKSGFYAGIRRIGSALACSEECTRICSGRPRQPILLSVAAQIPMLESIWDTNRRV